MAVHFYVVPNVGAGTAPDPFRPKYWSDGLLPGYVGQDFGFEGAWLVRTDNTDANHAALQAASDVIVIPPLDNVIGGALATVQSKMETLRIPAGWVTINHTYRDVLRVCRKIFVYTQRFQGLFPAQRIFAAGITLNTTLAQMSGQQRSRLQSVAESLGLNTSGVTNAMTLRAVLKLLADQLPNRTFGGEAM